MPAHIGKKKGKFRVLEPDGKIMKNNAGTAVDGGGHSTKAAAEKQARAINISMAKRKSN